MVAPVTGPFVKYPSRPFADSYQRGYRQKPPYDLALEYRFYDYYGTSKMISWSPSGTVYGIPTKENNFSLSSQPEYARLRQHAYNLAYERLRAKAMDTAGWAENLAQVNKTRQMFNDRAVQLGRFVTAIRKFRFSQAARILRTPRPSNVSRTKALSQNFLEYEYGLKPLVSDIQESLKILTGDPFDKVVRSRASDRIQRRTGAGGGFGSNPQYTYSERTMTNGTLEVKLGAIVRVTSPNLLLANQLGLIDLALPWKLMPFSFVIDWFVNVEQVASSLTDWYGVTLLNPYNSTFARGEYHYNYFQNASYTHGVNEGYVMNKDKESVEFDRAQGIPGPALIVKPFKGFSLNRGLQAMALVLSVFGK